jgi:hypothetical protein
MPGLGAPIEIRQPAQRPKPAALFETGHAPRRLLSAPAFLADYRERINALPLFSDPLLSGSVQAYLERLDAESRQVFATLLPQAAAFKRRNPQLHVAELIERIRAWSVSAIDRVCSGR